jgi:hypothetical protein
MYSSLGLTIFFGVLSVVLSVALYFRGRRRKCLTFTYELTQLYTRTHPEITILFRDKRIDNLSRLRVVVWNSGNQEIRQSDIPSDGSPSIELTGARVLSVAVLEASANTKCTASQRDNERVSVAFEFLNPKDYSTIDVLYESIGAKPPSIQFIARVIGGLSSKSRRFEQPLARIEWVAPIVFPSAWCIGAYYWARALPKWIRILPPRGFSIEGSAIFASLLILFGLFVCWGILGEYVRRYRASELPPLARRILGGRSVVDQSAGKSSE